MIANTAPVAWGAIGTPIHTLAAVTALPESDLNAMIGRILPVTAVIVPFWLVRTMVSWRETFEVLPAILVVGLSFALTQFFWSNHVDSNLVDIMGGVVSDAIIHRTGRIRFARSSVAIFGFLLAAVCVPLAVIEPDPSIQRALKFWLDRLLSVGISFSFASRSAAVAPNEIERDRAHGRIEQGPIVDIVIAPPKFDESFLNNVFRIGSRPHPLPRKKQQARGKLRKTSSPTFISGDILHDLFTVFYN